MDYYSSHTLHRRRTKLRLFCPLTLNTRKMAFKMVALVACCLAAVSAGIIPLEQHEQQQQHVLYQAQPQYQHQTQPQHVLYQKAHDVHAHGHEVYPDDPHPKYNFAYDVQDALSGDSKSQSESRDGDVVQGEYSLNDADGFRRTVKYTADSVNGFNAVVHREPLAQVHHKVVAAPAAVQYHHAPTAVIKTPVSYAAPAPTYVAPTYAAPAYTAPAYTAPAYTSHYEHQQQQQEQEHQHHYATYETPAPAHAAHDSHEYYHHQ
ncbi:pupal cuticle protein Edg-84A [Drosophila subobscura]|uniref:pupal cuticle protein Edg-84A n=1 Tax=Drosophila subobscura TaxID=7241 RepID=UPI00155A1554|nr:pupal cuticle protein Edg-84A [Drosophila subobscura]